MTDRAALVAAVRAGARVEYLFFWGHEARGPSLGRECLSQWYEAPFESRGVRVPTAEHHMMAEKARLFGDEEHLAAILAARHPGEAKRLGRAVRGFDEAVWDRRRFGIVVEGSVAKFSAHPPLRAFLLATGSRVLVEASPRDTIWGIGLGANHADAPFPERWRGQNLLGFALMAARQRLRQAVADE